MPPFSVSPESFGVVQSVNAWHAGVRYPGEAVVARVWDARRGTPLTGSAMFRVILLPDRQIVPELDIEDSRIAIAVGDTQEWSNRIAGLSHTSSELRESTATYLTSGQKDLDGLRQAVDRRACDIDEATTELARDSLRMGALLSKAAQICRRVA